MRKSLNDVKAEDVPEMLRGLKVIENDAIDKIARYKILLRRVQSAKKKLLLQFPNDTHSRFY